MRAEWIAKRRGQSNASQMHLARRGVVTEEMAFVAAREGLAPELVRDEVAIYADGGVYIEEKAGNLRLQEIAAGGDVYVKVNSGSIIDSRQEEVRDERTYEELKNGVWQNKGTGNN